MKCLKCTLLHEDCLCVKLDRFFRMNKHLMQDQTAVKSPEREELQEAFERLAEDYDIIRD